MTQTNYAREAALLAVRILDLLKRSDWDRFHFQIGALKDEFQMLITEHKLTVDAIEIEIGSLK